MAASQPDVGDHLRIATKLADAARGPALALFRSSALDIENKLSSEGAFDPVTVADREIESVIRAILARERPDDGILGEEQDEKSGESGLRWVIDPIDGTRSFMSGLPTWGVLIALNDGTRPIVGVMDQPFTGERYIGVADGSASLQHGGKDEPIRVRACTSLAGAVMCSTAPDAFSTDSERLAFEAISREVKLTRYGTDCYGYALVASGQIDLVVESGLNPYDIQAMIPIVQGAGGIVTDWHGGDCQNGGRVVAAGDPALHAQAVAFLSARV